MTEIEDAVAIYRLMSLEGISGGKVGQIVRDWCRAGHQPRNLIPAESGSNDYVGLLRWLQREQIECLMEEDVRLARQADELRRIGATFLTVGDATYPTQLTETLGKQTPPILACLGNVNLLNKLAVGFCGSRKATEKGLEVAADCATQLADENIVVISGNASGVDATAHAAALRAGGSTILVLPEGILRFNVRRALKSVWDWDRVLVLSEFSPGMIWSVHRAMRRNRTLVALSDAVILIEARSVGGSINAGRSALSARKPLYAAVYDGMPEAATGNLSLIKEGAIPLKRQRVAGRASLKRVFESLRRAAHRHNNEADQMSFGLGR